MRLSHRTITSTVVEGSLRPPNGRGCRLQYSYGTIRPGPRQDQAASTPRRAAGLEASRSLQVSRAAVCEHSKAPPSALHLTYHSLIPFNGGWTPGLPSFYGSATSGCHPLRDGGLFRGCHPMIAGWLPSIVISNGPGGQPRHQAPRGTHRTQNRQACPWRALSRRISHQILEAEASHARRHSGQRVVPAAPEAHLHDEGLWRGGRRRPPSERVEWARRCAERADKVCVCGR